MTAPRWRAIARARGLPRWAIKYIAAMPGSGLRLYVAKCAHTHRPLRTLVYVTPGSRTGIAYEGTW